MGVQTLVHLQNDVSSELRDTRFVGPALVSKWAM